VCLGVQRLQASFGAGELLIECVEAERRRSLLRRERACLVLQRRNGPSGTGNAERRNGECGEGECGGH
jgi:hypothetical protein